jgi:hypothetical protein
MKILLLIMGFLLMATSSINAQTYDTQTIAQKKNANNSVINLIDNNAQINFPANQSQNTYIRPTGKEQFKRYLDNTIGTGLIGVGFGSVIGQIAKTPPDWKKNKKGFTQRFASNFGENLIKETVIYGLEEALKLDSKFYKSQQRDFKSRLKNALLSGVTARTPSGKRVFNPAPIVGAYTANIISTETWYPKRYSYKDGLRQGTRSIGFSIGFGLLNEFLFHRK